jgi:hypothetical protein
MSSWILSTVTSQLPGLIEKYEPKIESSLKTTLSSLKVSNPAEVKLFLTNWRKLNMVVEEATADVVSPDAALQGGKRTRRKTRKNRKHRK